jgi:PadR family transcriptional regulator, regulatory protein PadR
MANMENEVFENLRLELRRGSLTLAVLAQLRTEHYGYILRKALADSGLAIDENTLYPLLRRLESQGLLTSHWREEEKRNKRFYRLSAQGEVVLYQLLNEHEVMNAALDRITAARPVVNGAGQAASRSSDDREASQQAGNSAEQQSIDEDHVPVLQEKE